MSDEDSHVEEIQDVVKPPEVSDEVKNLLNIRRIQKAKKPKFRRQESWRYKRVHPSWKQPRGIDSKMRLKLGGRPKSVEVGYRAPRLIRGSNSCGNFEKLVSNVDDLNNVDSNEVVRISGKVGRRKRISIIEKARQLNLYVMNPGRLRDTES
jgi:large subunit ribosomal protein L32e